MMLNGSRQWHRISFSLQSIRIVILQSKMTRNVTKRVQKKYEKRTRKLGAPKWIKTRAKLLLLKFQTIKLAKVYKFKFVNLFKRKLIEKSLNEIKMIIKSQILNSTHRIIRIAVIFFSKDWLIYWLLTFSTRLFMSLNSFTNLFNKNIIKKKSKEQSFLFILYLSLVLQLWLYQTKS